MGKLWVACALFVGGCGSVTGNSPDAAVAVDTGTISHWPAGWQYCKEITVSGAFPDDYSHALRLTSAELPAAHVKADLSDVRLYLGACGSDDDTQAPLAMWIESVSGGGGTIWTRTPVAANATLIAMYYGNSAATSVSSGDATFPLFDDFDGAALDMTKWELAHPANSTAATSCTDTLTVASGKLTLEELAINGYPETCVRDMTSKATFQPTADFGFQMLLDGLQYPNWGLGFNNGGFRAASSGFFDGPNWPTRANVAYVEASESGFYLYDSANSTTANSGDKSATLNPTIAANVSLTWTPSATTWLSNGTMIAANTSAVPTVALFAQLEVANWDPTRPTGKIVLDRVRVMRSVATPPTYAFGAEKTP